MCDGTEKGGRRHSAPNSQGRSRIRPGDGKGNAVSPAVALMDSRLSHGGGDARAWGGLAVAVLLLDSREGEKERGCLFVGHAE
eukprot:355127-Chlamydomonas_euryale.AAC.24